MSTETRLADEVRAALERDPRIVHPDLIAVSADAIGTVVLRGAVERPIQRRAAVHDARDTDGVFNVIDELEIHPPVAHRGADDQIRAATTDDRPDFRNDDLDVEVSEGRVTLTGHVRDDSHIDHAAEPVASVDGVVRVTSKVRTR
jgi:osmotically-inducible protein OsmY